MDSKAPTLFYRTVVVIFVTAQKENTWACYDLDMCAQNMMLAARSLGLDTCPIGIGKFVEHTPVYRRLEIPDAEQVHLALSIGYGDEKPSVHRRARNNIVYVDWV